MLLFIVAFLTIFVWIGRVFVFTWVTFHGRIYLNLVLLFLALNFVHRSRLELMYIPPYKHQVRPHSFPWFPATWIYFFPFTNRINLLHLSLNTDRLVIIAKGFLKLPNLVTLIKQRSLSCSRDLALVTFGELLIVLSTKLNLLYLLNVLFIKGIWSWLNS